MNLHHHAKWLARCGLIATLIAFASMGGATTSTLAQSGPPDTVADRVLGQPHCSNNLANNPSPIIGGLSSRSLFAPFGMAMDASTGRLYVSDGFNNRVLSWPSAEAFADAEAADIVLGQPGFSTNTVADPPTAASLRTPMGLAVDGNGNLLVADFENNRVLSYTAPITTGMPATVVLGQSDFVSRNPGLSATGLELPAGVAVDASGNVFVADQEHHRVLMYTDPITNGKAASVVFGQMNFASANMVITPTAASLLSPGGVTLDSSGNLYVADTQTNRVLRYTAPFTNSMNADLVLGQTDFFTDTGETDVTASSLFMPSGLFADSQPTPSLYVADRDNNRVLRYTAPFTNGMNANLVYGQADDFTTDYTNNNLNLATSRGLWSPNAIVVGGNGSIYIVDNGNNRVLAYDATSSPCGIFVYLPVIRK